MNMETEGCRLRIAGLNNLMNYFQVFFMQHEFFFCLVLFLNFVEMESDLNKD